MAQRSKLRNKQKNRFEWVRGVIMLVIPIRNILVVPCVYKNNRRILNLTATIQRQFFRGCKPLIVRASATGTLQQSLHRFIHPSRTIKGLHPNDKTR